MGHFPPAYVADSSGKPLHSWRVLVLPFIQGGEAVYKKYSFSEPWDGPNNIKLADEIAAIYRCPAHEHHYGQDCYTNYCLVTGPGTLFVDDQTATFDDVLDGTEHTLMLVEVNHGDIHWMQPKDLSVEEAIKHFDLETNVAAEDKDSHAVNHVAGQNCFLVDGYVRSVSWGTSAENLRALMTIAGDEDMSQFDND